MARKDKYEYDEYDERKAYLPGESNLTGKSGTKGYNATPIVQDRYGITGVNSGGINPVNEVLYYDALAAADYARNPIAKAVPTIDDKGPDTDPYAGGGGTQTTATAAAWDPQLPSFSYEDAPEFVSRYQGLIDEYLNGVLNRPAFSYNYENDPLYQQYAKSYGDAGRRAMQDTLAQISARTGGLASSYAGSASQQAYNQYMARLADKVPELQQLAYQMYQDDVAGLRSDLSFLQGMDATDYGRYQDRLGQYNTDRSFAYGQYRDEYGDELQRAQLAASMGDYRGLKALGIDTSTAEAKARGGSGSSGISKSDARSIIENHVKMGGSIDDLPSELIAASGYPDAYLGAMGDYYSDQAAAGGTTGGKPSLSEAAARSNISKGNFSPEVLDAYEYYNGIPYTDTITDFDEASRLLKGMGITERPITKRTWEAHKSGRPDTGARSNDYSDAINYYDSYEDYLREYLEAAVEVKYGI